MDPDWLGSPQHFIAAALIAGVVSMRAMSRTGITRPLAAALGIGAAMTAQVAWEVLEYLVRYADEPYASAYYDTIADSAAAIAGALVAAAGAVALRGRTRPPGGRPDER